MSSGFDSWKSQIATRLAELPTLDDMAETDEYVKSDQFNVARTAPSLPPPPPPPTVAKTAAVATTVARRPRTPPPSTTAPRFASVRVNKDGLDDGVDARNDDWSLLDRDVSLPVGVVGGAAALDRTTNDVDDGNDDGCAADGPLSRSPASRPTPVAFVPLRSVVAALEPEPPTTTTTTNANLLDVDGTSSSSDSSSSSDERPLLSLSRSLEYGTDDTDDDDLGNDPVMSAVFHADHESPPPGGGGTKKRIPNWFDAIDVGSDPLEALLSAAGKNNDLTSKTAGAHSAPSDHTTPKWTRDLRVGARVAVDALASVVGRRRRDDNVATADDAASATDEGRAMSDDDAIAAVDSGAVLGRDEREEWERIRRRTTGSSTLRLAYRRLLDLWDRYDDYAFIVFTFFMMSWVYGHVAKR